MIKNVVDTHGHYVFGVDDGATTLEMSIKMIKSAYEQGARHIFCTSHDSARVSKYKRNLELLQNQMMDMGLDIKLYPGMEIYCDLNCVDEVIKGLEDGQMLPMGNSKYVLLEFSPWTDMEEITECIAKIRFETEYEPIVAHMERYIWVREDKNVMDAIKRANLKIQINAYSLSEESSADTRAFARKLVEEKLVTFIGSDAHRSNHRPPALKRGIEYIYDNCDKEYADGICWKNFEEQCR